MASAGSSRLPTSKMTHAHMDAHPTESAIVLRFADEEEGSIDKDGGGEQMKIIQLKGLSERSDPRTVARFVQEQCRPLIPAERLADLEQLILRIQKRPMTAADSISLDSSSGSLSSWTPQSRGEAAASLDKLDEYMEMLYDEEMGDSKQRGVSLLAELVLGVAPAELSAIAKNDQLMSALARIMKEDSRRNFDSAIRLAQLFHRLSQFAPLHPILSQWKIGLVTLQLVDHELRRWELWRQQAAELAEEQAKRKWEFAMRKQDQLVTVCLGLLLNLADDMRTESKMVRRGLMPLLFKALDHSGSPQLLSAALKFLWKISKFTENQQQIANTAGTLEQLVSLLALPFCSSSSNNVLLPSSSSASEMRSTIYSLLFNCSFEPANRRRMVQAGLVSLLAPRLSEHEIALALMYQLSIVDDAKAMIAFTDCISTLLALLFHGPSSKLVMNQPQSQQSEKHETLVKCLLLNIMENGRNAQLLCGTDGQGLDALMAYALDGNDGDGLAMKIARNVAIHEGPTREMFTKWMPQLIENAIEKISPSAGNNSGGGSATAAAHIFGMECLGICALIPEAPWLELDQRHEVVNFLATLLAEVERLPKQKGLEDAKRKAKKGLAADEMAAKKGGGITDDVLLQAVMLAGTLAQHGTEMAEHVEKKVLPLLVICLNKRQEDDELVLQCVFAFVCLISHGGELAARLCAPPVAAPRSAPPVVELLLDLMHDKNPRLRTLCDKALQQIAESSAYWRNRILEVKFRQHNAQWLHMVETDPLALMATSEQMFIDEAGNSTSVLPTEMVLNTDQLLEGTDF